MISLTYAARKLVTRRYILDAVPVIEYDMSVGGLSPSLITVWLGANDAALPDGPDRGKHVDLKDYRANLEEIVGRFRAQAPAAKVLFITPPHIDDAARLARARGGQLDRSNAVMGEYARACVETGQGLGVPVLDLHSYFNEKPAKERNAYLTDGLHFNANGNRVVDAQLRTKLSVEFPELVAGLESETWLLPNSNVLN